MLGLMVQERRQAMNMTLANLSRQMGGSPSESYLSRVESEKVVPTPMVAARLADALQLPRDLLLNACGHASELQRENALNAIRAMLLEPVPVIASIPVMTLDGQLDPFGQRRQRMLKSPEDCFILDLDGRANAPYIGEVIASRDRKPQDGQGVVACVDSRASAWTYRKLKSPGTSFIENGAGEKRTKGFEIVGVIIRVATEIDFA